MKKLQNTSKKSVNLLFAFKNIGNLVTGIGALTILGLFPNQAQAVIITFEDAALTNSSTQIDPYTESGFRLRGIDGSQHFVVSGSRTSSISNGTNHNYLQRGSLTLEIESLTNDPFSIQNFDAGILRSFGTISAGILTVTGNLDDGGVVSTTFNATQNEFNTFNLPATFTNLNTVTIQSSDSFPVFDNFALNETSASVPFEFSPTLGILAVGSIFGISRLRKKAAVKLDK